LTGQAAALREMSWKLSTGESTDVESWKALVWLLSQIQLPGTPAPLMDSASQDGRNFSDVQKSSDALARQSADATWSHQDVHQSLRRLTATSRDFENTELSREAQIRRAQRLTLAIERLIAGLADLGGDSSAFSDELALLRQQVKDGPRFKNMRQMQSQFQPKEYSALLTRIAAKLPD